jgi:hypothetical protein
MKVVVQKSTRPEKKWMAVFENGKTVHFGARGYQDYTQHKDPERMRRYKLRHPSGKGKREQHGKSGIYTAGFWAMNLLWNKPSLNASARDIERRFGLKISINSRGGSKQRAPRTIQFRGRTHNRV